MIVLALNPGSGSLKFELVSGEPPVDDQLTAQTLASGVIEPIGPDAKFSLLENRRPVMREPISIKNHGEAIRAVLRWIDRGRIHGEQPARLPDPNLWACRVVHGADRYKGPAAIDETLIKAIEELDVIAPLHNAASADVMRAAASELGTSTPGIAVFDTAFHIDLPEQARTYAIPWELAARHGIRRYGFHGLSHQYLLLRYCELTGTPRDQANIVTLQSRRRIIGYRDPCWKIDRYFHGVYAARRSGDVHAIRRY